MRTPIHYYTILRDVLHAVWSIRVWSTRVKISPVLKIFGKIRIFIGFKYWTLLAQGSNLGDVEIKFGTLFYFYAGTVKIHPNNKHDLFDKSLSLENGQINDMKVIYSDAVSVDVQYFLVLKSSLCLRWENMSINYCKAWFFPLPQEIR